MSTIVEGSERLSAGAFGLDGWLRLAGDAARFPFRILGLGLELLGRTGQQSRRAVGGGVQDAVSQGYNPAGPQAAAGLWAVRSSLAPAPAAPPLKSPDAAPVAPVTAGSGGTAANFAETSDRKEKHMSCEGDLSGTDLKIIQYSIVTVDPFLKDYCDYDDEPCEEEEEEHHEHHEHHEGHEHHHHHHHHHEGGGLDNPRVLFGPSTISTTQDMTDADFAAWVIALNFGNPRARRVGRCEKRYLRVCYSVQCRFPIPEVNYKKRQVEVLEEIRRCLCERREDEHRGGPPAKQR